MSANVHPNATRERKNIETRIDTRAHMYRKATLMILRIAILTVLVSALLAFTQSARAQTVIYVNAASTAPAPNGLTWATAHRSLQDALAQAAAIPEAARNVEVWVAQGTYRPTDRSFQANPRTARFRLISNVSLFGGFAGTETSQRVRSVDLHPTVLSGDLEGDDGPGYANRCDNSYSVVVSKNATNVTIDGFVVSGGHATDLNPCTLGSNDCGSFTKSYGSAMFLQSSQVTVSHCVLRDNFTDAFGTIALHEATCETPTRPTDVVISNCVFTENTAKQGAAIMSFSPESLVIENCTISGNRAETFNVPGSCSIVWLDHGTNLVRNTIIHGNYLELGNGDLVRSTGTGTYNIDHTCVEFQSPVGQGNFSTNPLLVPVALPSAFRLAAASPAIDTGTTPALATAHDIAWNRRTVGPAPDLGASEFGDRPYTPVLYVNASQTSGANDGSSWANAFRGPMSLQNALAYAASALGQYDDVWVAAGTYKPSPPLSQGGSRAASFTLQSNLALYGGFQGNENSLSQRTPATIAANPTILSGDLNGDDDGDLNRNDNSYNVVLADGVTGSVLDGVTVTAGHASGNTGFSNRGGGMRARFAEAMVRNCTFTGNRAPDTANGAAGGAVAIDPGGRMTFESCVFSNNQGRGGGAIYMNLGGPHIFRSCIFENNTGDGYPGAVFIEPVQFTTGQTSVAFLACDFTRNKGLSPYGYLPAGAIGGGGEPVYVVGCKFLGNAGWSLGAAQLGIGGTAHYSNSLFVGNHTTAGVYGTAAALVIASPSSSVRNCTVVSNHSTGGYGAVAIPSGADGAAIQNCVIWGNTAGQDLLQQSQISGAGDSDYLIIEGLTPAFGGVENNGLYPLFLRSPSPGSDQTWGTPDDDYGDLRLSSNSPAIDSGDLFAVPQDTFDIDNDGNTTEALPLDLAGNPRFYDDPARVNTGSGSPPVDRGAYENNLATFEWANQSGGRWNDPPNWDTGDTSATCGPSVLPYQGVPTSSVRALFNDRSCSPVVSVTFPSNQDAYSLTIPDRIVNFNMRTSLGSGNLTLHAPGNDFNTPSLLIGQGSPPNADATLNINNTGTVFRSVIGSSAVLGATQGSIGRLSVNGQRSGLTMADSLDLGYAGPGFMDVTARAAATVGSLRLGTNEGASGQLNLTGFAGLESSLLYGNPGTDEVVIGDAGSGTVNITAGALFAAGEFVDKVILGRSPGSVGSVLVSGANSAWITGQDQFVLGDAGTANLTITDNAQLFTSTDNQIILAKLPGSNANITLGPGSSWTEDVQSVVLAGQGSATITMQPGSSLNFQNNLIINPRGTIRGSGTITGGIFNVGTIRVGNSPGTLTINGNYRQLPTLNDPDPSRARRSGRLEMEVAGANAGQYDQLIVNGTTQLAGGISISFTNGFVPLDNNLSLPLLQTSVPSSGQFDVASVPLVPALPGGLPRFVKVIPTGSGISIGIDEISLPYDPLSPPGEQFSGRPVVAATGDFDGVNGPDLALAVPGATDQDNGTLLVFRNAGTNGTSWNGWNFAEQVDSYPIGPQPVDLIAENMDGVLHDDLVVATQGDSAVRVLRNDGTGTEFSTLRVFNTDDPPTTVAAAILFRNGEPAPLPDLVIGLDRATDNLHFEQNSDNPVSPIWIPPQPPDGTFPIRPRIIRPVDTDGDKRSNLLVMGSQGTNTAGTLGIIRNQQGSPVTAWPQFSVPVGANPVSLAVGDLDGDGISDAVTANAGDASISVVLNRTGDIGALELAPAVNLPVIAPGSGGAFSVALGDLDGDHVASTAGFPDLDIAVVAGNISLGNINTQIFTLRNDTDLSAGTLLALAQPLLLPPPQQGSAAPLLVVAANVDEAISDSDDIIGLGEQPPGLLPIDNIVARPTPPSATGPICDDIDFNNDTSFFDPQDIDAFLSVYGEGPCIPEEAVCNDIDFNNDSSIFDPCDIDAFLLVFSEGPCRLCGQ